MDWKKSILFSIALCLVMSCATTGSRNAESVEIKNDSKFGIHYVYCTPVSVKSWGRNLLIYQKIIRKGKWATVKLPTHYKNICNWDVMLVSISRGQYRKMNINLCRENKLRLTDTYRIENVE